MKIFLVIFIGLLIFGVMGAGLIDLVFGLIGGLIGLVVGIFGLVVGLIGGIFGVLVGGLSILFVFAIPILIIVGLCKLVL